MKPTAEPKYYALAHPSYDTPINDGETWPIQVVVKVIFEPETRLQRVISRYIVRTVSGQQAEYRLKAEMPTWLTDSSEWYHITKEKANYICKEVWGYTFAEK